MYNKRDFTSISVQNVDLKWHRGFKKVWADKYSTFMGNIGFELSSAMELYVKIETGVLSVIETGKIFLKIYLSLILLK
ncbi:MAG: hypothetical protein PHY59_00790 [Methanobacterium sp.]|nr:hypothetical protein [Methanobacterium sp.]